LYPSKNTLFVNPLYEIIKLAIMIKRIMLLDEGIGIWYLYV
jgi:hypothetical protein